MTDLIDGLLKMMVGSCTCGTKTSDVAHHADDCPYRILDGALTIGLSHLELMEQCDKLKTENSRLRTRLESSFAFKPRGGNAAKLCDEYVGIMRRRQNDINNSGIPQTPTLSEADACGRQASTAEALASAIRGLDECESSK